GGARDRRPADQHRVCLCTPPHPPIAARWAPPSPPWRAEREISGDAARRPPLRPRGRREPGRGGGFHSAKRGGRVGGGRRGGSGVTECGIGGTAGRVPQI